MPDRYEHVWAAARPYLRARKNDVHIPLSYGYAERCWRAHPDADADVVLPAIMLHDTGWAVVDAPHRDRSARTCPRAPTCGARTRRRARGSPREHRCGPHVDEIAAIIDGHDTRLHALSRNDELVKDADKLWRYSTTGVAVGCDWFFGLTPGRVRRPRRARARRRPVHPDAPWRIARARSPPPGRRCGSI